METSDALDLDKGVFLRRSPRAIALSLKRSAERSTRRKAPPFRSAMSMLTLLREPRRQEPRRADQGQAGAGKGRTAQALSSVLTVARVAAGTAAEGVYIRIF